MAKLALLLSLLANGLAGYVLFFRGGNVAAATVAAPTGGNVAVDALERRMQEALQKSLATRDERMWKEIDTRLKRLDALRAEWTDALQKAQKSAENAAHENTGKLEELDQVVGSHASSLEKGAQALEALAAKVKVLEARPAAPAQPAPAAGPKPAPAAPIPDPNLPAMPGAPVEPPDVIKAKVDKALAELDQTDPERLYPAITVAQKYKVLEAVPKLTKLLHPDPHPDFFTRQAAAAALGDMRACDAVRVLAEALLDKDFELSPQARPIERRKVRGDILEWWTNHEDEVRARLKQPKAGK
jgi:Skp family chaperone for outer membrane proteins